MAKSEQKDVPLGQAWQEYWPLLFVGGASWKSDLEQLILRRVILLEFDAPKLVATEAQKDPPGWAQDLRITIANKTISMEHGDLQPLNCPIFFVALTEENPSWNNKHPIDGLLELDERKTWLQKLWTGDCQKILNRATIGVGTAIQKAVHVAIQDGAFEVLGKPSPTPFDKLKPLPQDVFASPFKLDFYHNTITFAGGNTIISSVSLHPVVDITRSNSFEEADLILIEEMKRLIDGGEASNIEDAANLVLLKANRQANASDESVIERLRCRFGREYPGYMSQKRK